MLRDSDLLTLAKSSLEIAQGTERFSQATTNELLTSIAASLLFIAHTLKNITNHPANQNPQQ